MCHGNDSGVGVDWVAVSAEPNHVEQFRSDAKLRSLAAHDWSFSKRLSTFPPALRGSTSTNSTSRGALKRANRFRT